jgi:predicted DNA-binding transcriptional regulator AlpA
MAGEARDDRRKRLQGWCRKYPARVLLNMANQLLKVREVCELLNVSRYTLWLWGKRPDSGFPGPIGIGTEGPRSGGGATKSRPTSPRAKVGGVTKDVLTENGHSTRRVRANHRAQCPLRS